ncbi:hypothetical protein [Chelatococcus reniformis]|nr:hypothetical protein [Chelatococcus reniformis]
MERRPAADATATPQPRRTLPEIETDPSKLPPLVARMRAAIIEAAQTGDVEKLRLALERNEMPPLLSKGQTGDPIAGLKARSGDGDGRETLGILLDVIEGPYVHLKPGTAEEMYVWPWFAAYPPTELDAGQRVEVYRILRAAEFKASLATGRYSSWRLGIGPDGTWHYFLAGE